MELTSEKLSAILDGIFSEGAREEHRCTDTNKCRFCRVAEVIRSGSDGPELSGIDKTLYTVSPTLIKLFSVKDKLGPMTAGLLDRHATQLLQELVDCAVIFFVAGMAYAENASLEKMFETPSETSHGN